MFKKPEKLHFCRGRISFEEKGRFVHFILAGGAEGKETARESGERETEFKGEIPYDASKEWQENVRDLMKSVLKSKHHDRLATILYYAERNQHELQPHLGKIASIELKRGILIFKDKEGKKLVSFDIADGLRELLRLTWVYERGLVRRGSRRERRREFSGRLPLSDLYERAMARKEADEAAALERAAAAGSATRAPAAAGEKGAEKKDAAAEKSAEAAGAPVDSRYLAALGRHWALSDAQRASREQIVTSVASMDTEEYDITARVCSLISVGNREEFARRWPFVDHSDEVFDLFNEDPDARAGYRVNPFKAQRWTPEDLRRLITDGDDTKLTFDEVAEKLYNGNYKDFRKALSEAGIPENVLAQLDRDLSALEIMFSFDDNRSRPDSLIKTYKKFKELSAKLEATKNAKDLPKNLQPFYEHREKIKQIVGMLEDYIVYINRLINLVDSLRYRPGAEDTMRSRAIMEFEGGLNEDGSYIESPENIIKRALFEVFYDGKMPDLVSPREYTSERGHFFRPLASQRAINFYDLNGRTQTVEGEWFTTYQSPETAYKLAYEAIVYQQKKPDGSYETVIDKNRVVSHFNELIQLGIAGYNALPAKHSIKSIIDELTAAGIDIKFTGNAAADMRNLYKALSLEKLADLYKKDSKKEKIVSKWRTVFLRVGSVIRQKNMAQRQEGLGREFERQSREMERLVAEKAAKIAMPEDMAEDIVSQLRETNRFSAEQLVKLKKALIGGAIVVLPDYGGGFFVNYEFDNNMSVSIAGALPNWNTFAVGAGIGTKFPSGTEDVTVSINAGAGYQFGGKHGWGIAASGRITKKFKRIDAYVEAGSGLIMGAIPVPFVGTGINWARSQERYERTLTKLEVENHIKELDVSADAYEEVKTNPAKYPEIAKILYVIQNAGGLDQASQRDIFLAAYEMFKQGVQSKGIDDSTLRWYERFIPTGAGLKFAMVAGIPVPYIDLGFDLWSRKLVFRIAADTSRVREITDAEATSAILGREAGAKIEAKTLRTSGELIMDPATGELILRTAGEGSIDFSHLDHFSRFREELSENANIFVEPAENGLLRLVPQEAYGNIRVFIDPELNTDAILVPHGSQFFISAAASQKIYIKREDITYPFKKDGVTEDTVIIISANPHLTREVIETSSEWYAFRTPDTNWQIKPHHRTVSETEEHKRQTNITTIDGYKNWLNSFVITAESAGRYGREKIAGRVRFEALTDIRSAYDRIIDAVSLATDDENPKVEIRQEIAEKIKTLCADKDFLQRYRKLSTEGYDLIREGKAPIRANWYENFPELVKLIKSRVDENMNEFELNAALMSLLIASFMDIQKHGKEEAAELYLDYLEEFEEPMLISIFNEYYKNDPEKEQKTKAAVEWIISQLENVDVTQPGASVEAGALFAALVGMEKTTGMRHMYNYAESSPEYGFIAGRELNVTAEGVSGEVARFWVKKLSPYVPGLQNERILAQAEGEKFTEYQKNMNAALRSPLALKLIPLVSVTLTADEMNQLAEFYKANRKPTRVLVNESNIGTVKKFLDICDRVRQAELAGEKFIWLDEAHEFKLIIDTKISMGVYKKCGNITGIMQESFALIHEGSKQVYFAAAAEGIIDVGAAYTRADFSAMIGLVLPIITKQRVAAAPEEETPQRPEKPQPEAPAEAPPQEIPRTPTAEYVPPETPTAKPLPTPEAGGGVGRTGGEAAGSTTQTGSSVESGGGGE